MYTIIQDGGQITGSTNISETITYIIKIPTANQRYSTMANSQKAYLGVSKDDRQLKMAAETGNTYISGNMTDSIEIPTTNSGFSMMTTSSIKV